MKKYRDAATQLKRIRRTLSEIDYICSGTLLKRTKICGKSQCACARDPGARHGPYYQWSRREHDRQVNTILSASLAPVFAQAIRNYRRLRRLLRIWEKHSAALMKEHARQQI
jgi:hypothetical protein